MLPRWMLVTCLLLPAGLAGCYAGAAGIALGLVSSTRPGEGRADSPPVLAQLELLEHKRSPAHIRFRLVDADSDPADVAFSFDDGQRSEPLLIVGDQTSLRDLETAPSGMDHHRLWDFASQLGSGYKDAITLRVRVTGAPRPADFVVAVGNDAPELAIDPSFPRPEPYVGLVGLRFRVKDSSGDQVSVDVEYALDDLACPPGAPQCWRPARPALTPADQETPATALDRVQATREGADVQFFWDAVQDLGNTPRRVRLRLRPDDGTYAGGWSVTEAFVADNNADPSAVLLDPGSTSDRSFEVPLSLLVRDPEGHRVTVVPQWAAPGEEIQDLGLLVAEGWIGSLDNPSPEDLAFLAELPWRRGAEAESIRRRLRTLTGARVAVRGAIDDSSGLPPGRVRVSDLVQRGLLHAPPGVEGPAALPPPPFLLAGTPGDGETVGLTAADLSPLGRPIRLHDEDGLDVRAVVAGFDPRDSVLVLEPLAGEELPATFRPGTRYELEVSVPLRELASSPGGVIHSFVWDAGRDLGLAGVSLASRVRLRATAIDSEASPSPEATFPLELEPLVPHQRPSTGTPPGDSSLAVGDFDGDGRQDLAALFSTRGQVRLFLQDSFGNLPDLGGLPLEGDLDGPKVGLTGDWNEDRRDDLAILDQGSSRIVFFLQLPGVPAGEAPLAACPCTLSVVKRPVSAAAGDLDGDGRKDIAVSTNGSVAVYFRKAGAPGAVDFEGPGLLVDAPGQHQVAIGDVDGDRREDVLVATFESRSVSVYARPDGRALAWRYDLATTASPRSAAVADLDGDSDGDLVVLNQAPAAAPASLDLFRQESGLLSLQESLVVDPNPTAMAVADFDGDRRQDLTVCWSSSSAARVFLQSVQSDRSFGFSAALSQTLLVDSGPTALGAGHFDADGRLDLAVAHRSSATLRTFLQRPAGTLPLEPSLRLRAGEKPTSLAIGDVDGDGRADLAIADRATQAVQIFLQVPGGTLLEQATYSLAPSRRDPDPSAFTSDLSLVATGDVTADGRNDLVLINRASGLLSVFAQRDCRTPSGCGSLGVPVEDGPRSPDTEIPVGPAPFSVAIADLNGDGKSDVCVADESEAAVRVHLQGPAGLEPSPEVVAFEVPATSMTVGDFDGDGLKDLVVAGAGTAPSFRVYHQAPRDGGPAFPFEAPVEHRLADKPKLVEAADLNGDGKQDLVVVNQSRHSFLVYLQAAAGTLELRATSTNPASSFTSIAVLDLDADGLPDILGSVLNNDTGLQRVAVFLQRPASGDAPFPPSPDWWFHAEPAVVVNHVMAHGDLTGDGREDLVILSPANTAAWVYLAR
ncbi:MAG: VCBS repeat-containing protein [Planctomycetes bacterium]|nr:VCBS repeat-containing protein [Planctomycetota bacterium]